MDVVGEPKRVVIADDHPPTRAAIRDALESGGFVVEREAYDAESAVATVRETAPDLVLLDVRMPGSGITAAGTIATECPGTAIVMLTVSEDDEDLFAALRVGARGYLLKGGDPYELPDLLRRTLNGEAVLNGALVARVVQEFQAHERRRLFWERPRAQLSAREREVLMLLARGATTSEIAAELFISQVTVRSHISAICRKLKLPDRHAAIRELRSFATSSARFTDDGPGEGAGRSVSRPER